MLSDDYDARIAAKAFDVQSVSVHKLIHLMIKQGKVTAEDGFRFADSLNKAGRAQDYTSEEASGRHAPGRTGGRRRAGRRS